MTVILHQPNFPKNPAPTNGQVWVDPSTNISWTYRSSTRTWVLT